MTEQRAAVASSIQLLREPHPIETLAANVVSLLDARFHPARIEVLMLAQGAEMLLPLFVAECGEGLLMDEEGDSRYRVGLREGIAGWVAATGQSLMTGNVRAEPRAATNDFDAISVLCVPLRIGGKVIGTLKLEDGRLDGYAEADRALLEAFAPHLALAVQVVADALTGLTGCPHFIRLAARAVESSQRTEEGIALVMIESDEMAALVLRYGAGVRDDVLRAVARRCRAATRGSDLLGRMGAGRFGLMLPATSRANAALVAERLRCRMVEQPVQTRLGPIPVTLSLGVACPLILSPSLPQLMEAGTHALARAQQSGGNSVAASVGTGSMLWYPRSCAGGYVPRPTIR